MAMEDSFGAWSGFDRQEMRRMIAEKIGTSGVSGLQGVRCLASVRLFTPRRYGDDRGWFCETYNARALANEGIGVSFLQDNQALSRLAGTLRGLHFQAPPHAQDKLVRCLRGSILDVAVDIRKESPTYGHWVSAELTSENGRQLFIPVGFAHGYVTLTPDTEVFYKVSAYYAPESDGGVRFDDPEIGINWPLPASEAVLSPKDRALPLLRDFVSPFAYDGVPLQPLEG
jgi:dTDP-4-dehydrorhamnose 3,5-epimerase